MVIKNNNLESCFKKPVKIGLLIAAVYVLSACGGGGGGGSSSSTVETSNSSPSSLSQCNSIENLIDELSVDVQSSSLTDVLFPLVKIESTSDEIGSVKYLIVNDELRPVSGGVLNPKYSQGGSLFYETNRETFNNALNIPNGSYKMMLVPVQNESVCVSNSDGSIYDGNSKEVNFNVNL